MKPALLLLATAPMAIVACTISTDPAATAPNPSSCGDVDAGETPTNSDGSDAAPLDANHGIDAGLVADRGGTTAPTLPDASPLPSFDCEMHVIVDQLKPTTCAVVDPVSHRIGHLEYICAGGPARLTFDDLVLEGSLTNHTLTLSTCREDPVSWLDGHYEVISVSADLQVKKGALSFARATGVSCPKVYSDCNATAGVELVDL